ncbi:ABC transporter substrate-binding protein [Subtercola lobariae]|nr:ABC transporter substrate-binding protein [Subtercola lobariae]
MSRAARIVAIAAVATVGLAGCASGGSTASSTSSNGATTAATLALNFSPSGIDLPVYDALAKGYYADEGLNMSILVTKSGQDAINAVNSGQAEFGTANLPYLALSESQNIKTLSVGNRFGTHTFGLFIAKDGGSTNLTDLEGKTVLAASSGIIDETKGVLEKNGVDTSKINFATIAASSLLTAYAGGQGDALATSIPFGAPAVQPTRPSYEVNFSDYGATIPDYTYFVRPDTATSSPAQITAFLKATYKGLQDSLNDPSAAVTSMAAQVPGLNTDTALAQWKAIVPFICTVGAAPGSSVAEMPEAAWASAGGIMSSLGITPTTVDTSSMMTNQFTTGVTDITCPIAAQ